jgi:hypothetical protein
LVYAIIGISKICLLPWIFTGKAYGVRHDPLAPARRIRQDERELALTGANPICSLSLSTIQDVPSPAPN